MSVPAGRVTCGSPLIPAMQVSRITRTRNDSISGPGVSVSGAMQGAVGKARIVPCGTMLRIWSRACAMMRRAASASSLETFEENSMRSRMPGPIFGLWFSTKLPKVSHTSRPWMVRNASRHASKPCGAIFVCFAFGRSSAITSSAARSSAATSGSACAKASSSTTSRSIFAGARRPSSSTAPTLRNTPGPLANQPGTSKEEAIAIAPERSTRPWVGRMP